MKILIYGAGVLGSLYAAKLQAAGQEVWLLARGQRLADLQENGLILEDENTGQRTTTHLHFVDNLAPEDRYDLALVIMRKNQVNAILPALAENRRIPNVLFMVNNAAGSEAWTQALGGERVLLGFPGAGGAREGAVVRYAIARSQPTSLGELDGQTTPRLLEIAGMFEAAGFPVALQTNMDAWLKTHVALVSPVANALYMAGGDNYRLAHTRDGLVLLVRAVREGFNVLRALGIPVTPAPLQALAWIPEPLLVAGLQRWLATRSAELMLARHANAARDEMQQLADEFRALAERAHLSTPAISCLYTYLNPATPPAAESSQNIALDWNGVFIGLAVLLGLGLLLRRPRRKRCC
jgi:2-dehydropantoate 2-reductase